MTATTKHIIDASQKSLGRIASDVAILLMGKDKASFAKNEAQTNIVEINNASKMRVTEKQLNERTYKRFSGYPGGLKEETMAELVKKKGYGEALRRAVYGMLPNNRLRSGMINRLIIKE